MPSITKERLQRLEAAERKLQAMIDLKSISWVGQLLGETWATCQALKPWNSWSVQEKELLKAICRNALTALELYKRHLPQDGV